MKAVQIEKKLKQLRPGRSIILITTEDKYYDVASKLLEFLTKKGDHGVYVSINKPYTKVQQNMRKIDWTKILFLDGISRTLKDEKKEGGDCIFLQGPTALTEMGICVSKAVNEGDFKFFMLDSMSALLAYNRDITALKFIQFMASKSKSSSIIGIVVVNSDDEEKKIVSAVKDLSDEIIKV